MKRGDVVLANLPFIGAAGSKVRPALVVQNDALNRLHLVPQSDVRRVIGVLSASTMQQVEDALKFTLDLP